MISVRLVMILVLAARQLDMTLLDVVAWCG